MTKNNDNACVSVCLSKSQKTRPSIPWDLENTPKCTRLNCFLAPWSRKLGLGGRRPALTKFDKILSSDLFNRWCVNSLQCPYKRRMPGLTRENKDVKQETGHVLRFKFVLCFCNVSVKWLFSTPVPPGQMGMVFFPSWLCTATLATSSFWTSSPPLASSTRSTTWRLVSFNLS